MKELWKTEPAIVVAFIQTIIAMALAFGLRLTAVQVGAILAVVTAAGGLLTRSQVTPAVMSRAVVDE